MVNARPNNPVDPSGVDPIPLQFQEHTLTRGDYVKNNTNGRVVAAGPDDDSIVGQVVDANPDGQRGSVEVLI